MKYQYTAYSSDKKIVTGIMTGTSPDVIEEALYKAGFIRILSLKKLREKAGFTQFITRFSGARTQDIVELSRELATLVESGITLLSALELLAGQASRRSLRTIIRDLATDLRGGTPFSTAISKYPRVFPMTFQQVIQTSEQSGQLEVGLRRIVDYLEKRMLTRKKTLRAMAYPALVLVMAVVVVGALITVALPPLVDMFNSFGAHLPTMTKIVMGVANFLIDYKLYILWGLIGFIAVALFSFKLPVLKPNIDKLALSMPVIGSINLQRHIASICNTMSMLLKAGVVLPKAMRILIQNSENGVVRHELINIQNAMLQGDGLSKSMAKSRLFPPLLVEMTAVGEKTGDLESALMYFGTYYDDKVDQRISTLISFIEPSLTIVAGIVVGAIAVTMIQTLYGVLGSFS